MNFNINSLNYRFLAGLSKRENLKRVDFIRISKGFGKINGEGVLKWAH